MAESTEAEWASAKRQLFDALLPRGAGGAAARLDGMSLSPTRPASAFASPFRVMPAGATLCQVSASCMQKPHGFWLLVTSREGKSISQPCAGDQAQQAGGAPPQLSGRAAGYAQAVCELNQAVASRKPFNAINAFAAACTGEQPRECLSNFDSVPHHPVCHMSMRCHRY